MTDLAVLVFVIVVAVFIVFGVPILADAATGAAGAVAGSGMSRLRGPISIEWLIVSPENSATQIRMALDGFTGEFEWIGTRIETVSDGASEALRFLTPEGPDLARMRAQALAAARAIDPNCFLRL